MKIYDEIKAAFDAAENERVIDRKVAKIPGWHLAMSGDIYVYEKARLDLVSIGSLSFIPERIIIDVIRAPHSLDGFVICR